METKIVNIPINAALYQNLSIAVGTENVNQAIERLILRELSVPADLDAEYKAMSEDLAREKSALEWCNGLIGDTLLTEGMS
jgi:hypothetical protein